MESRNVTLTLEKAKEFYNGGNAVLKELALQAFTQEELTTPKYTDIKTFDDAFRALGIKHPLVQEFISKAYPSSPDLEAYMMLRIICAALNEGWEADYSDPNQEKWFPWFRCHGGGLVCAGANNAGSFSYSYYGVRLAFRTRELAEYCGKQFIDIWADFLFK